MNGKPVTIVVSDLHMGGGDADPGDDHVYQNSQFRRFVDELTATPEGTRGEIELIINGDFLELVQVAPEAYTLGSARLWCSEDESLVKLEVVLDGHADIFAALRQFDKQDNLVTIAAGNHDVDLYWTKVQDRLRNRIGEIHFELGDVWFDRYDGRLSITHGHMFDPANKFKHWANPILDDDGGGKRLEMCPGTIFVVSSVNRLEKRYPFADNLKPVTKLAGLLWKEQRMGLLAVAWMFGRFIKRYPQEFLGAEMEAGTEDTGRVLLKSIKFNPLFAAQKTGLYRQTRDSLASVEAVQAALTDENALEEFLIEMMARVAPEVWLKAFDDGYAPTLGIGGKDETLAIIQSNRTPEKDVLRAEAARRLAAPLTDGRSRQVICIGHTHQPDEVCTGDGGVYFNTGS
jgi:UDP-2,3-diacylglucosamine pyrophosphatase LpxH